MSYVSDRAEELGYVHLSCSLCGWRGWTDTGICEGCVFCSQCGEVVDHPAEWDVCEDCSAKAEEAEEVELKCND